MTVQQSSGSTSMLGEWLKVLVENNGNNQITAGNFKEKLRKNLEDEFDELGKWLEAQESWEIGRMCDEDGTFSRVDKERLQGKKSGKVQTMWSAYLPVICNGIAEIRYFMAGVKTQRTGANADSDITPKIEHLTDDNAYARCIVGMLALSEIYGDHCHLDKVIQDVSSKVERKLRETHKGASENLDKCKEITDTALMFGRALLQDKIRRWRDEYRTKGGSGSQWRLQKLWVKRNVRCKAGNSEPQRRKIYLEQNKSELTKFLNLNDDAKDGTGMPAIADILADSDGKYNLPDGKLNTILAPLVNNAGTGQSSNVDDLIKSAIEDIKIATDVQLGKPCDDSDFCARLKCVKEKWEKNNQIVQAGAVQSGNFWDIYVKGKVGELFIDTTTSNGGTVGANCDTTAGLDTANKEACKHITALLNKMYKTTNGPNKYSDQIIQCLLLKAYAKKLKEEAKSKGYCDIGSGLQKAFNESSAIMNTSGECGNANANNCFECSWNDNDGLDQCTIRNGNGENDQVKNKVDQLLEDNNQTKQEQIQKTVTEMHNKNNFCERLKCVTERWWKDEENGGKNGSPVNWEQVWTEVQKDVVQPLGSAMYDSQNSSLDNHCSTQDYNNKEVCLLFGAGLRHLYRNTKDNGNPAEASFKRTMMCAALNVYADQLIEKSNDKCPIGEDTIKKMFTVGNNQKTEWCKTGGNNNDCFECKREAKLNCPINSDKVETKLKDMFDKEETGLKKSLDNICGGQCEDTEVLCNRAECVKKQWLADSGKKQTVDTEKNEMWTEVEKEFTNLDSALSTNGVTDTDIDNLCNEVKCTNDGNAEHCVSKATCKLIVKELKNIHTIQESSSDTGPRKLNDRIFRSTMRCVALNALIYQLKEQAKQGGYGCAVQEGINKAFDAGKLKNNREKWCNKNGKGDGNEKGSCEECGKDHECISIEVGGKKLWTEVWGILKTTNIQPTLSTINDKATLCDRLHCALDHWKTTTKAGQASAGNDEEFWKENGPMRTLWNELAEKMKENGGSGNGQCDQLTTHSEKTACKYLHAGFTELYNPSSSSSDDDGNILSTKHPSFRQTMGCFLLHAYAKHMKDKAVCNIDKGIEKAFELGEKLSSSTACNGGASGKGPCVPCQWNEKDKLDGCLGAINIKGTTPAETAKKKVEKIVTDESDNNISTMLSNINKRDKLCDHMKCIASHLNSSTGQKQSGTTADEFWKEETGELHKLWKELADAMKDTNGKTDQNGCDKMNDNGTAGAKTRPATDPEKRACQHLTLGFTKLESIAASNGAAYPTLKKDPSFVRTMGCILLHYYAKQMEKKSTCVINAGIEKAFKAWNDNKSNCNGNGKEPCVPCQWQEADYESCEINVNGTKENAKDKLIQVQDKITETSNTTLTEINKMDKLCDYIKCAAPNWFKQYATTQNGTNKKTWCDFWEQGVKTTLQTMFKEIGTQGQSSATNPNAVCNKFGDGNPQSVERKACNHITAGLEHIKKITSSTSSTNGSGNQLLDGAVGCIALNMYATKIKEQTDKVCPIDENKIKAMFDKWNQENNKISSSSSSCNAVGGGSYNICFKCQREEISADCQLSVEDALVGKNQSGNCNKDKTDAVKVQTQMKKLLNEDQSNINTKIKSTLTTITNMSSSFCTQLQCAAKKYHAKNNGGQSSDVSWNALKTDIGKELAQLLEQMMQSKNQAKVADFCKDNNWYTLGHKQSKTNKAACLLFAAGLQHIYSPKKDRFSGPSFGQTMGCLFLKKYAEQLQKMAEEKRKGQSWVHPLCSIKEGINHAFGKSDDIMRNVLTQCKNGTNGISCFECKIDQDYDDCSIGKENVNTKVEPLLKEKSDSMQQTLENTICPILPTDLLTPFLPLAPVSIGLSVMAYYLWKYFGPLGKGGPRFRRSPGEIPGPSVQEQVLDHVEEAGPHEYRLVKERKPRSAPTRTKRSGSVNRRTIIEIHFEVLDECQKGDTQLNQKDFLELLVKEFMGSELMEEEQVSKEEVLMEGVPLEQVPIEEVPMERVPNLGSGFMV
ncbi:SICAvar, type I [Plasmodium knowlesi strain H]|uniref:SICAvar, type I n=3 Tax=Plasmodium knowlesi TaxID=5850 RepID=A0A1A7VRS2_PLAKH|nr:SICAvar, type I [Plasmodium knowlesi strain H]OTN66174.1 SICAvar type I [Plasmodium knowlesi]CAA9989825.1 SICAvar, type I [Plasmodium knowlesi strain H]SBO24372.1 SICAvar, type I [Plasmodium knowlesi strain H]SBO26654.1 SICAvar, type I [Plasmodium knowlesi strain H]VVS79299.1 SICAvar, type I [Plasmodium knowlesi strain H]